MPIRSSKQWVVVIGRVLCKRSTCSDSFSVNKVLITLLSTVLQVKVNQTFKLKEANKKDAFSKKLADKKLIKSRISKMPRCKALAKSTGHICHRRISDGSLCWQHNPDWQPKPRAKAKAKAKKGAREKTHAMVLRPPRQGKRHSSEFLHMRRLRTINGIERRRHIVTPPRPTPNRESSPPKSPSPSIASSFHISSPSIASCPSTISFHISPPSRASSPSFHFSSPSIASPSKHSSPSKNSCHSSPSIPPVIYSPPVPWSPFPQQYYDPPSHSPLSINIMPSPPFVTSTPSPSWGLSPIPDLARSHRLPESAYPIPNRVETTIEEEEDEEEDPIPVFRWRPKKWPPAQWPDRPRPRYVEDPYEFTAQEEDGDFLAMREALQTRLRRQLYHRRRQEKWGIPEPC